MNPIKKFFEKKKIEREFKKAGPGHKLTDSSPKPSGSSQHPSSSQGSRQQFSQDAQRAGAAALARIEQKHSNVNWSANAIKAQAIKELEQENSMKEKESAQPKEREFVQDCCPTLAVSGVYFKCPIVGPDILPKLEMKEKIKNFLYQQLDQEQGLTACLIIQTLNPNKDKVRIGTETLSRYLSNILDNPGEEKYRKIRVNNRVFQERIVDLEGAFDFLTGAGFQKQTLDGEDFYVYLGDSPEELENLQMLKEALLTAEPILPTLDRNLRLMRPADASVKVDLPQEFFCLTKGELVREQELRTEAVELLTTLRTKAMRERDAVKEKHIYKYTLMRIRFSDGAILQGTFYVHEKLHAVREFISECLRDPGLEYQLMLAGGIKLTEDATSLLDLKLVPAAILNFMPLDGTSGGCRDCLKPEMMMFLEDL